MRSLVPVFAFVLSVGYVFSGSIQESNQFVDSILFDKLMVVLKDDIVPLQDFHNEFDHNFAFLMIKVTTDYDNGVLHGLSKGIRARDCSPATYITAEVRINCTLVFHSLLVEYKGWTKYGKIPAVPISVNAPLEETYLAFELASNNQGKKAYIRNFDVTTGIRIHPRFSGLSVANSLLQGLQADFTEHAKSAVMDVFNNNYKLSFERILQNNTLPKP